MKLKGKKKKESKKYKIIIIKMRAEMKKKKEQEKEEEEEELVIFPKLFSIGGKIQLTLIYIYFFNHNGYPQLYLLIN